MTLTPRCGHHFRFARYLSSQEKKQGGFRPPCFRLLFRVFDRKLPMATRQLLMSAVTNNAGRRGIDRVRSIVPVRRSSVQVGAVGLGFGSGKRVGLCEGRCLKAQQRCGRNDSRDKRLFHDTPFCCGYEGNRVIAPAQRSLWLQCLHKGVVAARSGYVFAGEGSVQPKRTIGHRIVMPRACAARLYCRETRRRRTGRLSPRLSAC